MKRCILLIPAVAIGILTTGIASVCTANALPPTLPADFNDNGQVDAADYAMWANGSTLNNEVSTVGTVDAQDYTDWRARFGTKVVYLDLNGNTTDGSGAAGGTANWDTTSPNWNTDSTGNGADPTATWSAGDYAIFAAGTDAIGSGVNGLNYVTGTVASGAWIQEGIWRMNGNNMDLSGGILAVSTGGDYQQASSLNLIAPTAPGVGVTKVVLDGGTMTNRNPGFAGSFIQATQSLELTANGGHVSYFLPGTTCNCIIFTPNASNGIRGQGGTTTAGVGTLTKDGPGEFRYQGAGLNVNTSFEKLVVEEGLYRVGSSAVPAGTGHLGFGAEPQSVMADQITINGGAIGSSLAVTFSANRGIVLGSEGGWFNNGAGTMSVQGVVSGAGSLNKQIDPNAILGGTGASGTLNLTSATGNTYDGGTNITAGNLKIINTSGSGTGTGAVTIGGTSTASFGTFLGQGSASGATTVNQFGEIRPGGTTTATLDNAGTLTLAGGVTFNSGSLLTVQLGSTGNDLLVVGGVNGLNFAGGSPGTISLNVLANGTFSAGTYTLIDYDTSYIGSFTDLATTVTVPVGFTYAISDNTTATTIELVATAAGAGGGIGGGTVPEPSSLVMLVLGLAGLAMGRRTR